MSKSAL
ncbi:hypothetical protein FG05_35148 [Fusarium graminearum]|nr:hypothetical protein FG05_35148 [Fusarium graminearum]